MIELVHFLASLSAGAILGLAFFWGLWVTVKGLEGARHPALWALGSVLLRFGVVLAGFYLLARYAGWLQVLAGAVGFALPRLVIVRRMQPRRINGRTDA